MTAASPPDTKSDSRDLFPSFTQELRRELGAGRSINLTGSHEQGVGRVLEDLCRARPAGVRIVRLNLHDYRHNHAALVAECWRQIQAGTVNHRGATPRSLGECCDRLRLAGGEVLWLILERLDHLIDLDRDPCYDCGFFRDQLNNLRNRPQVVLLSHTSKPHRHYSIPCGPGQATASPPDFKLMPLPSLGEGEMRAELERLLPELATAEVTQVVEAVRRSGDGYALFDYLSGRLRQGVNAERPLAERLEHWRREYQQLNSPLSLGQLSRFSRRLVFRVRVLGGLALGLVKELSLWGKLAELVRRRLEQLRDAVQQRRKPPTDSP